VSKRIEINPGEWFLVADKTILVREYESVLGAVSKIGTRDNDRIAYLFTFTGKVNNEAKINSVTVAMSPEDAFALASRILDGLQSLLDAQKEDGNG
jgi:hypothetical protein